MTFVRVMGFSVAVLLFYTAFANMLPQVQSDPPVELVIDADSMDMAGMVSLGEKLFSGNGTCTLCHNDLGRAPDLLVMDLAKTFTERLVDPLNQGASSGLEGAKAIEVYLRESMVDPSAFVVAGFGQKGSDDKISPMPAVDAAPIDLSEVEMNATIAFLQDKAGFEPTVQLPSAEDTLEVEDDDGETVDAPATDIVAALDKFMCSACHDLEGSGAEAGPVLQGISQRMTRGELMISILDPNATIATGFDADMMPQGMGETMHVSELTMIVDYLMALEN